MPLVFRKQPSGGRGEYELVGDSGGVSARDLVASDSCSAECSRCRVDLAPDGLGGGGGTAATGDLDSRPLDDVHTAQQAPTRRTPDRDGRLGQRQSVPQRSCVRGPERGQPAAGRVPHGEHKPRLRVTGLLNRTRSATGCRRGWQLAALHERIIGGRSSDSRLTRSRHVRTVASGECPGSCRD